MATCFGQIMIPLLLGFLEEKEVSADEAVPQLNLSVRQLQRTHLVKASAEAEARRRISL